jgi:hypothetical protein
LRIEDARDRATFIIFHMARGWESKSVEAQQAEATESSGKKRARRTPVEAAREREREGLRLMRERVRHQLESSQNPRHRQMLESSLAELERKLKELEIGE